LKKKKKRQEDVEKAQAIRKESMMTKIKAGESDKDKEEGVKKLQGTLEAGLKRSDFDNLLASLASPSATVPAGDSEIVITEKDIKITNSIFFKGIPDDKLAQRTKDIVELIAAKPFQTLTITNSLVTDVVVIELCKMLKTNSSITELNLDNNDIRGVGIHALGEMLSSNATLKTIRLQAQKVPPPTDACQKVCDCLAKNNSLLKFAIVFPLKHLEDQKNKYLNRNQDEIRKARNKLKSESQ